MAPLSSIRTRVLLAVAAAVVLVAGVLVRPETPPRTAAIEEAPAPILQDVVERREAQAFSRRLQETARAALPFAVRVTLPPPEEDRWSDWEPPPLPLRRERYGVVLGDRVVLAQVGDRAAGAAVTVTLGDGRALDGRIIETWAPRGIGRIEIDTADALPAPPPAQSVAPGDSVVAVAPGVSGPIVAPLFIAAVQGDAVLVATDVERFEGLPVFTEAGGLLGLIARIDDGLAVLPLAAATAPLPPAPPAAPTLGLTLALGDPDEAGARGVVVAGVAPGGAAARARLRPGDTLLQIEEMPVATLADARGALQADRGRPTRLRVRRGRQLVTLLLRPGETAVQP